MKIERFEDIQAWQKARELVNRIYSTTNKGDFAKDCSLKDQLRRASISVMSNISEGYARQTDKEFAQFLYIASGSTAEVQSLLYAVQDLNYISKEEFDNIYELSSEVARLIAGFRKYLQRAQK
ncbi:MAG: four helix bundle protein [Dehalococcoidia bacterium]|nr:MAG: four helix bundle protein [Dehalococcoidia bacterium]